MIRSKNYSQWTIELGNVMGQEMLKGFLFIFVCYQKLGCLCVYSEYIVLGRRENVQGCEAFKTPECITTNGNLKHVYIV